MIIEPQVRILTVLSGSSLKLIFAGIIKLGKIAICKTTHLLFVPTFSRYLHKTLSKKLKKNWRKIDLQREKFSPRNVEN